ncbi:hypothetical protein [Kitasatospora sp. NPDC051914]|uniref:hypothetical protein n=1 Tax=Kitasatospora sp. NPDC051914 TaxID=3154945 RepID=UPI00341EC54A
MRPTRRAVAAVVGSMAVTGLLPFPSAHADETRVSMHQDCYDYSSETWWQWNESPVTLRAGEDRTSVIAGDHRMPVCRITIHGPGAGTPG